MGVEFPLKPLDDEVAVLDAYPRVVKFVVDLCRDDRVSDFGYVAGTELVVGEIKDFRDVGEIL